MKKLILIFACLFFSGCQQSKFCLDSGYNKGSRSFALCEKKYNAAKNDYEYCKHTFGLDKESKDLKECLSILVPIAKKEFLRDKERCGMEDNMSNCMKKKGWLSSSNWFKGQKY